MGANRKVTELNAVTSLGDSDLLTMVVNGVNVKMTKANFVAGLGVTGSIEQDGAVTGTPILDVAGTVNKIRNAESGNGIIVSTSPENGLLITHAFAPDATGLPILLNSGTATPDIASLVEGAGVELTANGNSIEIEFTGIPTDVVVVNSIADFPPAIGGVITLVANTAYQISGDVSLLTNRIVGSGGNVLFGTDASVSSLTYTGTGVMFTSATGNFKIRDLSVSAASGTLFAISSAVDGLFQLFNVTITTCDTLGTITNMLGTQFVSIGMNSITTDGFTFAGTHGAFVMVRSLATVTAGTLFDLGTATFVSGWSGETSAISLAAGTTFLSGLASSGNMATGALGTLFNTRFSGTGTILDTITVDDARWQFFGNDDIQDTRSDGLLSLTANATETAIAVATTPVLIAGTWVVERSSQFTGTVAGRLTYNGVKNTVVPVTANMTANPVSGTNIPVTFHLYKNGAAVLRATQGNEITSTSPKNTTLVWQIELATDDYLEIWVSNDSTTSNVLVESAKLRIN